MLLNILLWLARALWKSLSAQGQSLIPKNDRFWGKNQLLRGHNIFRKPSYWLEIGHCICVFGTIREIITRTDSLVAVFSTRESSPKNENLFWGNFTKYSTIFDLFWTPYSIGYGNPSEALSLYRVLFWTSRENPCWSHNRDYNRENTVTDYLFRPLFMIIKLPRVSDA